MIVISPDRESVRRSFCERVRDPKVALEVQGAIEELIAAGDQFERALERFRECPDKKQDEHEFHGFVALQNALYDEANAADDYLAEGP
jgi:hypothetical protein